MTIARSNADIQGSEPGGSRKKPPHVRKVHAIVMPNRKPRWRAPAASTETRQYPMAAVAPLGSTASAINKKMAREMLAM